MLSFVCWLTSLAWSSGQGCNYPSPGYTFNFSKSSTRCMCLSPECSSLGSVGCTCHIGQRQQELTWISVHTHKLQLYCGFQVFLALLNLTAAFLSDWLICGFEVLAAHAKKDQDLNVNAKSIFQKENMGKNSSVTWDKQRILRCHNS